MTEKRKRFVDEFILQGGNAAAAARSAGYSAKGAKVTGSKLLADGEVRATLDDRLESLRGEKIADEQELLESLTAVVRGEVTDEVATNSGRVVVVRVNTAMRLKAAEMLLKVFGAFKKDNEQRTDGSALFVATLEKIWQDEQTDSSQARDYCNDI